MRKNVKRGLITTGILAAIFGAGLLWQIQRTHNALAKPITAKINPKSFKATKIKTPTPSGLLHNRQVALRRGINNYAAGYLKIPSAHINLPIFNTEVFIANL